MCGKISSRARRLVGFGSLLSVEIKNVMARASKLSSWIGLATSSSSVEKREKLINFISFLNTHSKIGAASFFFAAPSLISHSLVAVVCRGQAFNDDEISTRHSREKKDERGIVKMIENMLSSPQCVHLSMNVLIIISHFSSFLFFGALSRSAANNNTWKR